MGGGNNDPIKKAWSLLCSMFVLTGVKNYSAWSYPFNHCFIPVTSRKTARLVASAWFKSSRREPACLAAKYSGNCSINILGTICIRYVCIIIIILVSMSVLIHYIIYLIPPHYELRMRISYMFHFAISLYVSHTVGKSHVVWSLSASHTLSEVCLCATLSLRSVCMTQFIWPKFEAWYS